MGLLFAFEMCCAKLSYNVWVTVLLLDTLVVQQKKHLWFILHSKQQCTFYLSYIQ